MVHTHSRQDIELLQRDVLSAGGVGDDDTRVAGDERRRQVGRVHDERRSAAQDRVIAAVAQGGEADVTALLETRVQGRPVVPAARPLAQVAADRSDVADLRRADAPGRLGDGREIAAHPAVLRHGGQGRERAETQGAVRVEAHVLQLANRLEVDQRLGPGDAVLQLAEQVDSAGERQGARSLAGQDLGGVPERRGLDDGEATHGLRPP